MKVTDASSAQANEPVLRYRRRSIGEAELGFLRETVASGEFASRREMARQICARWDWRQADGNFSEYACLDLLLRLEERGLIQLPARARAPASRKTLPLLPSENIALQWIEPLSRDLNSVVVRPIQPEERLGWRLFMDRYHYLGDKPIVGEHLLYAAFMAGELVALIGWAAATLHAPLREQFVGWDEAQKRRRLHLVVNNIRFLVLPWVRTKHLASRVMGLTLRRLGRDWQTRWNHPVLLAETFVDRSRFKGTCYRASNWNYLGMSAGRTRRSNDYLHGGTPKALYIYELHRHARRMLRQE
jgi:hypothetical protein